MSSPQNIIQQLRYHFNKIGTSRETLNCLILFCLEDKGDGSDAEIGISEEDYLIQDEICKSRLASIKRVSFLCSFSYSFPDIYMLLNWNAESMHYYIPLFISFVNNVMEFA